VLSVKKVKNVIIITQLSHIKKAVKHHKTADSQPKWYNILAEETKPREGIRMNIIQESSEIDKTIQQRFVNRFKLREILRKVYATKMKGVAVYVLFSFLLSLVFNRKNLYTLLATEAERVPFGKEAIYRCLSNSKIHWEEFTPELAERVIAEVDKLTSDKRITAWVIDDSPYYRNRSKKVELLSRMKDHSENKYYKGYAFLALGWSDGVTFIPTDFRMVASGDDKNLIEGSHIKEDKRTLATKRRINARTPKPTLVLQMLERAEEVHPETKHVLFDSWFSAPKAILDIKRKGFEVVAMLKNHENYRYLYNGECLSLNGIYKANKKRPGKSRYLLSVTADVRHNDYEETVPARIVFVRNRNKRSEWLAIICTDMALAAEEIIALYGKRWDIEPFFKVLKSNLRLTNEFQLRSFDALCAHAAIVLTRYMFLALETRENKDGRSMGELFWLLVAELEDISFGQAFDLILAAFKSFLAGPLTLANDRIALLAEQFIDSLPAHIKFKLRFSMCES
jgi:hypothetical protein